MAIVDIEAGSKASSKQLNDNFHYLQDLVGELSLKIDGSEDTVDSKIATLKNTLTNQINDLQTNVNTSIDEVEADIESTETNTNNLKTDIYTNGFLPNYSAGVSITSGYTATGNGWVYFEGNGGGGVKRGYVNGEKVFLSSQGVNYHQPCGAMVLIGKGDVVTTSGGFGALIFYPCKGGI